LLSSDPEDDDDDEDDAEEEANNQHHDDEMDDDKPHHQAMPPVNILIPYHEFCHTFEKTFKCHKCNQKRLNVSQETYGFATEIFIVCEKCEHSVAITPIHGLRKKKKQNGDDDDEEDSNNEDNEEDSPGGKFMDYDVNYSISLMMHQLGIGLRGVVTLLSFLGIAAGIGNTNKWKRIQEEVGIAKETVADVVVNSNIKAEMEATRRVVQEAYQH